MTIPETCREIRELLPGFAVGALEPGEREYVRHHLAACADCPQELAGYQAVTEALLQTAPRRSPPPELRERIAQAVVARPPRFSAPSAQRPQLVRIALAVAVVLLLLVNGRLLIRLNRLSEEQAELRAQVDRNQTGLALGTYPSSQVAGLEGDGVFGTVVYDPERSLAMVYAWGLEPLPADRAYQLWLRGAAGERVSGALFQAAPGEDFTVVVVVSPEPVGSFIGIGATVEPAGGSPGPTGPPVFTADF